MNILKKIALWVLHLLGLYLAVSGIAMMVLSPAGMWPFHGSTWWIIMSLSGGLTLLLFSYGALKEVPALVAGSKWMLISTLIAAVAFVAAAQAVQWLVVVCWLMIIGPFFKAIKTVWS